MSPAVASIVARLLRKDPRERFSSATELASALREARERPNVTQPVDAASGDAPTTRIPVVTPPPRRSVAPDRPEPRPVVETFETDYVEPRPNRRWLLFPLLLAAAIAIGYFALRGSPSGAKAIVVPKLQGQMASTAQKRLLELGLQSKVTSEDNANVPQDRVIRQDPPAGAQANQNDVVNARRVGRLAARGRSRHQGLQRRRRRARAHRREAEVQSSSTRSPRASPPNS